MGMACFANKAAQAVGADVCGCAGMLCLFVAGYIAGQVVTLPQHLYRADEHTEHVDRPQLRQPGKPRSSAALHEGQDCLQQVGRARPTLLADCGM